MHKTELQQAREVLLEKQQDIKGEVGDVFETTDGLFCKVTSVVKRTRYVEFEDGFQNHTTLANLKRGICKNRRYSRVWGVGINEKGKHAAQVDGVGTKIYDLWTAMLARCYGSSKTNAYRYCTVDPRFHYFQDFAEWCTEQVGFNESDFMLDKDMLQRGNTIYGPDTCAFIPPEMNYFYKNTKKARGDYPVGVHIEAKSGKYVAQINKEGRRVCLGRFTTPEKAFHAYKTEKELQSRALAEKWKDCVDERVYNIFTELTINIED